MNGLVVSDSMMLVGIAALGIGAIGLVLALGLRKGGAVARTDSATEQINAYGASGTIALAGSQKKPESRSFADGAKAKAEALLAGSQSLEAKVADRLDGAGYSIKPAEWILIHASITIGSALFWVLLSGGRIGFIFLGLVLGVVVPWVFLGLKRSRRLKAFSALLPDTLQLMASSLSAGLSLTQSVDTIVREGAEPITSEFRRVVVESRLGVPLEDAMAGVAQRMESRDFDWVVMAIRIQRDVGGNLAELLLTVAATLREREYIRRHVRALSAEGRLSMYVLGGLPPIFLVYLSLTKWSYVSPLFSQPIGLVLLGVMSVLLAVGVLWMSKVSKVEL